MDTDLERPVAYSKSMRQGESLGSKSWSELSTNNIYECNAELSCNIGLHKSGCYYGGMAYAFLYPKGAERAWPKLLAF